MTSPRRISDERAVDITGAEFRDRLIRTGLTAEAAARFFDVPERRISHWRDFQPDIPADIASLLNDLLDHQTTIARQLVEQWSGLTTPRPITFAISTDEASANALGWPSIASQTRVAEIAREMEPSIMVIVERDLEGDAGESLFDGL